MYPDICVSISKVFYRTIPEIFFNYLRNIVLEKIVCRNFNFYEAKKSILVFLNESFEKKKIKPQANNETRMLG